jgi:hypothetical protein
MSLLRTALQRATCLPPSFNVASCGLSDAAKPCGYVSCVSCGAAKLLHAYQWRSSKVSCRLLVAGLLKLLWCPMLWQVPGDSQAFSESWQRACSLINGCGAQLAGGDGGVQLILQLPAAWLAVAACT